jgi:hypothetical protein
VSSRRITISLSIPLHLRQVEGRGLIAARDGSEWELENLAIGLAPPPDAVGLDSFTVRVDGTLPLLRRIRRVVSERIEELEKAATKPAN